MTGLRVSALALAGVLAAGAPPAAWSQGGPPVRLVPPPAEAAPEAPAPSNDSTATPRTGAVESTIEVTQPAPLDTGAVGLAEPAALNLPANPWVGTNRLLVDRLLAALPNATVSRPTRDLAKRLLTVAATPPAEPASSAKLPSFIGRRAAKLMAMGDVEAATGLARLVPGRAEDEALARVQLDAAFEAFDNAGACTQVRTQIGRFGSEYWHKALIFCQALANEPGLAQLGLSLLREQKIAEDPSLIRLVSSLGGDTRATVDRLPAPTPLHIAMMRAARQNLPADLANTTDPLILRMIAASPNATSELRLIAAERAEAYGALPAESLAPLYDSFTFSPEQLGNALSIAQEDKGPRGRAALHRAIRGQPAGIPRAEIMQRSWRLARERGGYATAVRVDLPALLEITPAPDLMFFAVDATRALLLAGRLDEAKRWYALLSGPASTGNELAATGEALLWPLMWLAEPASGGATGTALTARLDAWRKAQERIDSGAIPRRAAMLSTLLLANGVAAESALIDGLLDGSPDRETVPMPPAGLWLAVRTSADAKRTGEAVLLILNMLGPDGGAGVAPQTISLALESLRTIGLGADARALAVETAIAAGL